jgi:hypothetical protein
VRERRPPHARGQRGGYGPILPDIFAWLEAEGVRYVVLRNWRGLPRTLEGNDLDILVDPQDVPRLSCAFKRIARAHRWRLIQDLTRPYIRALKFARAEDLADYPLVLQIDVFTQANWRLFSYMSASVGLDERVRGEDGVWHLPAALELFLTLSHHLLWTGQLHKGKYAEEARRASGDLEAHAIRLLRQTFGDVVGTWVWDWARSGGEFEPSLRGRARRQVIARSMGHPISLGQRAAAIAFDEYSAHRRPRGVLFGVGRGWDSHQGDSPLLTWLQSIWKYNHLLVGTVPGRILSGPKADAATVRRVAYASSAPDRRTRVIRRLRARGWIIGLDDLQQASLPGAGLDLVAGGGPRECGPLVAHRIIETLNTRLENWD